MSWNNVIGQRRVKEILKGALRRGRLAHAYLFSGPEGVGMDAAAIELAKTVNCERGKEEACDACESCIRVNLLQQPNVRLVFPMPVGKGEKSGDDPLAKLSEDDVALVREELRLKSENPYHEITLPRANGIKINSIRHLRRESALSTVGTGRRVFLILESDMLNEESANALLKILEEPHEDTMLILTTSHPERLLPTITSRCQQMRFDPLSVDELAGALQARQGISRDEAVTIANLSAGSYLRAIGFKGTAVEERRNDAVGFLRKALYRPREELIREIERLFSNYEKHEMADLLTALQAWLRDAMLKGQGKPELMSGVDRDTVEKFSAHHSGLDYGPVFAAVDRAISLLGKNVYIPLILIQLSLELRESILSPLKTGAPGPGAIAGTITKP